MNKRDLIRQYGTWVVLIIAYLGFHFLKNKAWIEEQDIASSEISPGVQSALLKEERPNQPLEGMHSPKNRPPTDSGSSEKSDAILPALQKKGEPSPRIIKQSKVQTPIKINQAGPDEWKTLRGIGDYRSERIIRFRSALGGFHSIDQVAETYGLPDTIFEHIRPFLRLDSSFQKLKINQIPYDSLYQHPYITKQMAYFIARHREKQSPITKLAEMYDIIKEKDHERLNKLEPYLDFSIE